VYVYLPERRMKTLKIKRTRRARRKWW